MKKLIKFPKVFNDPKYQGKHVLLVGDKVYSATPSKIKELWDRVRKKHPKAKIEYSFTPKGNIEV